MQTIELISGYVLVLNGFYWGENRWLPSYWDAQIFTDLASAEAMQARVGGEIIKRVSPVPLAASRTGGR